MGQSSQGTKIQLSISSVFTDIGLVVSVDGPNPELKFFDGTHLQSTDNAEEHIPTVWGIGEISFGLVYMPLNNGHKLLLEMVKSMALGSWKVIYADGSTGTSHPFSAYVKNVTRAAQTADGLKATVTLQGTGTMTPPSSGLTPS